MTLWNKLRRCVESCRAFFHHGQNHTYLVKSIVINQNRMMAYSMAGEGLCNPPMPLSFVDIPLISYSGLFRHRAFPYPLRRSQ
jgi:hypothetical protein